MAIIFGSLDYSISCPCLCIFNDTNILRPENCKFYYLQKGVSDKERERRLELQKLPNVTHGFQEDNGLYYIKRFVNTAEYFYNIMKEAKVETVVIEDYSLHGSGRLVDIVEATMALKLKLLEGGMHLYGIPPKTNKKIFSGNGNSNKEGMIAAAKREYGWDIIDRWEKDYYGSPVSDIVDSYSLIYTYMNMTDDERTKYIMF